MKAFSLKLGIAVAGLLLTAGPALAQAGGDRGSAGGGDRGGGGGSTTTSGGGMSAGSGGGGSVSSGGGGGSSSGGGGGFSSPSSSGFSSPSISMGDRSFRTTAPEHRVNFSQSGARSHTASSGGDQAAARPSGGSSSNGSSSNGSSSNGAPSRGNAGNADRGTARGESGSGERAVARAGGAAGREPAAARDSGGNRRMNEGTNNASGANEIPTWSRPRGDRPATDVAVARVGPQPPRDAHDRERGYGSCCYYGGGGGYYDPYYVYGGGYSFYDSAFYGYPFYSPFGFGYGIPLGYFDPFYADPYDYGGGYGAYSSNVYGGHDQGSLKLKVKPRNAKVYVDGYYVGLVDEFDGAFQKLTLNGGRHKVELRAEGYETTEFDVLVTPEQTVTFAGDMKKIQ